MLGMVILPKYSFDRNGTRLARKRFQQLALGAINRFLTSAGSPRSLQAPSLFIVLRLARKGIADTCGERSGELGRRLKLD